MKQLLFLLLFPCLALAQYPNNGNQKITLGEQTTADGLVFRGVANDTNIITPFSDTSAYIILDTIDSKFYHYNRTTTYWALAGGGGGSTLDTATMLLPYYRAGRNGIIQAADVPTLNQNTTGSAATLTTSRTFQTNLASTSTASFNGSANVTPGVTGTLPVANGGTNASTFTAGSVVFAGSSGTYTQDNANLFWDNSNNRLGIGTASPAVNLQINGNHIANKGLLYLNGTDYSYLAFEAVASGQAGFFFNRAGTAEWITGIEGSSGTGDKLYFSEGTSLVSGARMTIISGGNVGIGTTSPAVQLHTTSNVRFAGLTSITDLRTDADGDLFNGSDFNLKNSIDTINFGLSDVLKLKPVSFNWNDEARNINEYKSMGFIAQDIMDVIPNAASTMGDGDMQVDYNAIVATLTKAIQEQQALIKALEQRIINLENK